MNVRYFFLDEFEQAGLVPRVVILNSCERKNRWLNINKEMMIEARVCNYHEKEDPTGFGNSVGWWSVFNKNLITKGG